LIFQKVKPIRDKKYLDFIRSLPCLICGAAGSEAHHEAREGHGTMGGKPGDDRTIPLCVNHHAFGGTKKHPGSVHGMGKLTGRKYWEEYGVDIEEWIVRLNLIFSVKFGREVGEK
jgi:Protein of unknown function (DUF968)